MVRGSAFQKFQDPEVIYTIASRGKTYVEIGTRWGGSAVVAGLAGCEVHCIDPWDYPEKPLRERTAPEDVRNNWAAFGLDPEKLFLYQQRHPPWPEAIKNKFFDIGMIDGAHTEEECQEDWDGMILHVTRYVLFHDAVSKIDTVGKIFMIAAAEPQWEIMELPFESQFGILRRATHS